MKEAKVEGFKLNNNLNNIPSFLILELLARLEDVDDSLGIYKTIRRREGIIEIETTKGVLLVPDEFIKKQLNCPSEISNIDLILLAASFKIKQ
jgi:hypothetical protein